MAEQPKRPGRPMLAALRAHAHGAVTAPRPATVARLPRARRPVRCNPGDGSSIGGGTTYGARHAPSGGNSPVGRGDDEVATGSGVRR
jgi:hypothetical protein